MKIQLFPLLIAVTFLLSNCSNNTGTSGDNTKKPDDDTPFYPIGNFIQSQLDYLDSMPLAIIKYSTTVQKIDTSVVEKDDFRAVASAFFTPDISSPELRSAYAENAFIDASLGTITLTYTTSQDTAEIKRADILLNQETGQVKTIYVEKGFQGQDSTLTQKMLWTTNRNCQITTLIQKPHQPESVIIDRYVWDNREGY